MQKNYVVYFSGYGHTERLAQFVAEGAQARLIVIDQQGEISKEQWDELAQAKSIIFGSPTYMGSVAWQFKKFVDVSSKCWYARTWQNKVAGGFTISASPSGDKFSTIQYMVTLAMQQGMIWVGQLALPSATLNRLGGYAGLIAQVGPTSPASDIPADDLETARLYGQRVAEIALKL